jgi:FkbM family methyltransferase
MRWIKKLGDRLPIIAPLRRERDIARRDAIRLHALLDELRQQNGVVIVRNGPLRLMLDPTSRIDREILGSGNWEIEQIAQMTRAAQSFADDTRPKLFLDIGAHWGLYALTMWRLGIFTEIHCFEPDPHNFAQLGAQIFLNSASYDIRLHNKAVLDAASLVHIRRSTSTPENRGSAALMKEAVDATPVTSIAIDDLITVTGAIVFIKIDTEGSERAILKGMQKLLARNLIYLQVEIFPDANDDLLTLLPANLVRRAIHHWDHVYASFPIAPAG